MNKKLTEKIIFIGACCCYVLAMSAAVHLLSYHATGKPTIKTFKISLDKNQAALLKEMRVKPDDNEIPPKTDIKKEILEKETIDLSKNVSVKNKQPAIGTKHSPILGKGKKAEEVLHHYIAKVADQHEVDPALIKAIIWAESGFNPKAVSEKGARGLMQLMPNTAKSVGVKDSMNPASNIKGGVKYFKQLMTKYKGNEEMALAAYHLGSNKVKESKGIPKNESTQIFIRNVIKYYNNYKAASKSRM